MNWLKRGTHRSTKQLKDAIHLWTDTGNDNARPLTWHKSAGKILENLANYGQRTSDSGH